MSECHSKTSFVSGGGAVQDDDVWLKLVDDLLQVMVIGEGDILRRYFHGWSDSIDLNTIDIIYARDTIMTEADDGVLEV